MQLHKRHLTLLLAVISVAFIFISYQRGMKADVAGDYYIYWQTGKHFLSGEKLYTPGLVDGGFTYPPFAALFFSLFSAFPFHISAFVFTYLVNYGLWMASIFLTKNIFELYYPQSNTTWPLILAFLFSIGFYWHNYIWMNANLPVLCLTLLGIRHYQQKKFGLSYVFFMAGTFFKITPVLFLAFAAIKRGPKDWPKIILIALPFIIIPALLRGWPTGLNDWQGYYAAFVAPFSKGQIDENIISLGIPALLEKLDTGNAAVGLSPLFHLSPSILKTIILYFQIIVMGALTAKFVYDRYVKKEEAFSAADYSLIFLVTLLLPGRVWAHHHVCAIFIYTYVFHTLIHEKRTVLLVVTCVLCLLTDVISKAIIGQTLTDVFKFYSFITVVMIWMFILCITLNMPGKRKYALSAV
ncbi:glycosyltransferase family 87 protein [Mucilaginibacter sp. CSA2-8R]|uniref:glycosyltransferase family 87 protein n=1 Tax=Mucilaginibacter sp. CSA2-8R TaxID=3141542 RepID=UPI00315DBA33